MLRGTAVFVFCSFAAVVPSRFAQMAPPGLLTKYAHLQHNDCCVVVQNLKRSVDVEAAAFDVGHTPIDHPHLCNIHQHKHATLTFFQ
jgi:hypothetical protein